MSKTHKLITGLLAVVMVALVGLAVWTPSADVAAASLDRWGGPGTRQNGGSVGSGLALTPLSDA